MVRQWSLDVPFLLIVAGVYVERAGGPRSGWPRVLAGGSLAFISLLGILSLLADADVLTGRSGGRIGDFLADLLSTLVTVPGAFVILPPGSSPASSSPSTGPSGRCSSGPWPG